MSESRRKFLKTGLLGGVLGWTAAVRADYLPKLNLTPPEIEGPFYPVVPQKDRDFDLTKIEGRAESAAGSPIWIEGRVVGTDGGPIEDAAVELWQANAAGRYRHPGDRSGAPLDPNFQGWAVAASGSSGGFRFKTVLPGTYQAGADWTRPPHIHFKVTKRGYVELITQMYFPGHELNAKDLLLRRKSAVEQKAMTAELTAAQPEIYRYQIVLQRA